MERQVERQIEVSNVWTQVWAHRRPVMIMTLAGTAIALIVAFLLPPWYKATGSLLPPSEEDTSFSVTRLLRGVAVPGVSLPTQASPADVFLAILESRRVNAAIVERFDLKKRYKKKYMQEAIKELGKHAKFKLNESGTLSLEVEDKDPARAAEMLNTYIELLDEFNREVRMTKGRRTREFVENRLDETKQDLMAAENKLAEYQTKHKTIALSPEMSSAVEAAARIYAQRVALQVRLGVVRSYSRGETDEERRIMDQLQQLDRQLGELPETGLELARLVREVKVQEQVFILLTAQYEEARIDEARDVVTVDVLDYGVPPERKSRPRRLVIGLIGLLVSLAVGIGYALSVERRGQADPPPTTA